MPITQNSKIQVRSGLQENLPQLAQGEFGWAIDSQRLFIGNGNVSNGAPFVGNTEVLTTASGSGGGGGGVGPQGPQGASGAQGPQGNAGTGAQGAQGNQGNAGSQGNQGFQGVTGSGAQGNQGTTGLQGPQGNQGNQGGPGTSTWTVDDFVGLSTSSLFNWSNVTTGTGNIGNAGTSTVGHNGVINITASGNANSSTAFWFGFNSGGSAFVSGANAAFSIAASINALAFAGGPVSFAIFSTNPASTPTPTGEYGFTCDTLNNTNGNWWIGPIAAPGTTDTGVAGNSGYHVFEISVSANTATFFVDGLSVGTAAVTANSYCPTFVAFSETGGSGATSLNIDWVAVKTATPSLI